MADKPIIKVTAICGSLRKNSYNAGLLKYGISFSTFVSTHT